MPMALLPHPARTTGRTRTLAGAAGAL